MSEAVVATDLIPYVYDFLVRCGYIATAKSFLTDVNYKKKNMPSIEKDLLAIYDIFIKQQERKRSVNCVFFY